MRKPWFIVLSLGFMLAASSRVAADEPVLHAPGVVVPVQRWSPASTDYHCLLWNDWSPAFFPGIYGPGWGGWWYMYFGHTYSPCYSPRLHSYPYCHYTHPYFNYPLDSVNQHWYIGLGNNTRPMVDYWAPRGPASAAAARPAPAKVIVTLPEDATLIVNGQATELASGERSFTTPELKPGKDYYYVLKAEVVRAGEVKTVTKEVSVAAGRESRVHLELPSGATARR